MYGSALHTAPPNRLRRIAAAAASALVVALLVPVSAAGEASAETGVPVTPTQNGTTSPSTGLVARLDDLTVERATVDYDHPTLTAHGRVRLYDPATQTYLAHSGGVVVLYFGNMGSPGAVDEDGWFTAEVDYKYPVPSSGRDTVEFYWNADQATRATFDPSGHWYTRVATWSQALAASSWNLVLDQTTATVKEPASLTVSGTVTREVGGTWQPAAGVLVTGGGRTDDAGRFTTTITPDEDGPYEISLSGSGLFIPAGAPVSDWIKVDLIPRSQIVWTRRSVSPYAEAALSGKLVYRNGPSTPVPVYLQESPDGKTGWRTLTKVTASEINATPWVHGFGTNLRLSHPNWYFRAVFKGTAAVQPSIGPVWHSSRLLTRVAGLNVNPNPVGQYDTALIAGMVQKRVGTTWRPLGAKVKLFVYFRYAGTTRNHYLTEVITTTTGKFAVRSRLPGTGAIFTEVITSNKTLFSSNSPWVKVKVTK